MAVVTNRHSQDPKNDYNVCHSQRQPPWIFLADLEPRQALSWVTFLGFETISKAVSWLRNNIEKLMRDKSFYPVLLPVDVGILLSRMVPETIKVWQRMIAMYTTVNDSHLEFSSQTWNHVKHSCKSVSWPQNLQWNCFKNVKNVKKIAVKLPPVYLTCLGLVFFWLQLQRHHPNYKLLNWLGSSTFPWSFSEFGSL